MTSSDIRVVNLAALFRTMAKAAVTEAVSQTRTTKQLAGSVEDLQEVELDVAWIRMDGEANSSDPTQSDNHGEPGVIPTTRLGETFAGEQVRTTFDGSAGATSMRTSALKQIVVPFGAEDGEERISIDGNDGAGYIGFFNDAGELVGFLNPQEWDIGDLTNEGRRVTIDPLGGIRIRSANNTLVAILDDLGYTLRDPDSGLVTAEIQGGNLRLIDPTGTDDIEMVTSSQGTLPNPFYKSTPAVAPGASLVIPAAVLFTTTPADDIEIGHVAAWKRATNQSATMTPPAGWTEIHDNPSSDAAGTIHSSVAYRDPATGTTGTFTSTQSNWDHEIGTHVVIRGGGAASPAYRSISSATVVSTKTSETLSIGKPSGAVQDDVLLVFVEMGTNGGGIPTGWTTPAGFKFLGANFSTSGAGATQSTIAVGAWVHLAGASEPSTFETTVNLPTGTKVIHSEMVAISGAFLVPGGVQIRIAGRPIRRLLAFNELAASNTTLCDFQNIPQGYDNLELLIDSTSATTGSAFARYFSRFNNDSASGPGNYFYKITQGGASTAGFAVSSLLHGLLPGVNGGRSTTVMNIYGYASMTNPVMMGTHFHDDALDVISETVSGQWNNSGVPINRINVAVVGGPANPKFAAGSRAYLYGY